MNKFVGIIWYIYFYAKLQLLLCNNLLTYVEINETKNRDTFIRMVKSRLCHTAHSHTSHTHHQCLLPADRTACPPTVGNLIMVGGAL